jgi:hypothetical protein
MAARKQAAPKQAPQVQGKATPSAFNPAGTLVSNGKAINVSTFQKSLYYALLVKSKADESARAALYRVVGEQYTALPTHEQYTADQKALKAQCEGSGASYAYQREQYAGAIMSLFKKLPVSTNPEAVRKAEARKLAKLKEKQVIYDAGLKTAPKSWVPVPLDAETSNGKLVIPEGRGPGAPKGQTQEHPVSPSENIEQVITRLGVFEVLEGLTRILAADKSTELNAKTLAAISAQLRRESKRNEVAAAPIVEQPVTPATPAVSTRKPRQRKAA